MEDMIFRGALRDFLESKKLDILKLIRFGISDPVALTEEFHIVVPIIDFNIPIDVIRIDDDKWNQTVYIVKFSIYGTTEVLNYKPSTSFITMPEWAIRGNEIWFRIEEHDLEVMKTMISGLISTFQSHLLDIVDDIRIYNANLPNDVNKLINIHSNRINQDNNTLSEIKNYLLFRD